MLLYRVEPIEGGWGVQGPEGPCGAFFTEDHKGLDKCRRLAETCAEMFNEFRKVEPEARTGLWFWIGLRKNLHPT